MILDIFVALILAGGFFFGRRKGILGMISGLAGIVVGFLVAVNFAGWFSVFLDKQFNLVSRWSAYFLARLPFPAEVISLNAQGMVADKLTLSMTESQVPVFFQKQVLAYTQVLPNPSLNLTALGEVIAYAAAVWAVKLFAFVLVFIISILAVKIASMVLTKGMDGTIIGSANRLIGGSVGLVTGLLITVVILTALMPLLTLASLSGSGVLGGLSHTLSESKLALPLVKFMGELLTGWLSGAKI